MYTNHNGRLTILDVTWIHRRAMSKKRSKVGGGRVSNPWPSIQGQR